MKKLLLFLLVITTSFAQELLPSTVDQISSYVDDHLIGGIISPSSGQPTLERLDLTANSTHPITIKRLYIPTPMPETFYEKDKGWDTHYFLQYFTSNHQGWSIFPHRKIRIHTFDNIIRIPYPNGITLDFDLNTYALLTPQTGITNQTSPKLDPRNISISSSDDTHYTIHFPDGRTCHYAYQGEINSYRQVSKKEIKAEIVSLALTEETLPNGQTLHYSTGKISSIDSSITRNRHTYTTHTNLSTTYSYTPFHYTYKTNKYKGHTVKGERDLPLLTSITTPKGIETITYNDRLLLESYTSPDLTFRVEYAPFNIPSMNPTPTPPLASAANPLKIPSNSPPSPTSPSSTSLTSALASMPPPSSDFYNPIPSVLLTPLTSTNTPLTHRLDTTTPMEKTSWAFLWALVRSSPAALSLPQVASSKWPLVAATPLTSASTPAQASPSWVMAPHVLPSMLATSTSLTSPASQPKTSPPPPTSSTKRNGMRPHQLILKLMEILIQLLKNLVQMGNIQLTMEMGHSNSIVDQENPMETLQDQT